MKRTYTSPPLLKGILYVLLVSQLWISVVSYCQSVTDSSSEYIELTNTLEKDYPEEFDTEEKDNKIRFDLLSLSYDVSFSSIIISDFEEYYFILYPEIVTPPPKQFFS